MLGMIEVKLNHYLRLPPQDILPPLQIFGIVKFFKNIF